MFPETSEVNAKAPDSQARSKNPTGTIIGKVLLRWRDTTKHFESPVARALQRGYHQTSGGQDKTEHIHVWNIHIIVGGDAGVRLVGQQGSGASIELPPDKGCFLMRFYLLVACL
ncbi:hypothetical protein J6590_072593 [Homalodisca vitripennis]|nr:hypothetical protein J6590_072593 [Homalodisca vitripennis]